MLGGRGMPGKPSRPVYLALLVALLGGCGAEPPSAPDREPELVVCPADAGCRLLAAMDRAVIEGGAAALLDAAASEDEVLFRLDFEGSGVEALRPPPPAPRIAPHDPEAVSVEELDDARFLRFSGETAHSRAMETAPIALKPGRPHVIRYRVAGRRIGWVLEGKGYRAGVEALFFRLREGADPAVLLDPARRETTRVEPAEPVRGTPVRRSPGWRSIDAAFEPPPGATHAILRIHSGPLLPPPEKPLARGGPPADEAEPAAWFDDLELVASGAPVAPVGTGGLARASDHPLAVAARVDLKVARRASETREGIAAPVSSLLRWRLEVPADARLHLGYGLLPGGGRARFEAWARRQDGGVEALHGESLSAGDDGAWSGATADLSGLAGQVVDLELRTVGDPEDGRGAAWSEVRVEPARSGRLVVLFAFDTLAAKRTSTWGFEKETTPNLSRIAADGLTYRQARSVSPWTLPSFATLHTGLPAATHGAGRGLLGRGRSPLRPGVPTLAGLLREAGWQTRAWVNNPYLDSRVSGLHRGFDRYIDYGTRSRVQAGLPGIDAAIAALEEGGGDRFFFVHLLEPHGPYRPNATWRTRFVDPEYRGRFDRGVPRGNFGRLVRDQLDMYDADRQALQDLYAALLGWGDEQLGRLFDAARASGDEVLFVVTSDHGEEFWEHERFEHGHSLYDELLHVPLVTWRTGGSPATIPQGVSLEQVAGTVLDFAGLPADLPRLPEVAGDGTPLHATGTLYGFERRAVVRDGWKYVHTHRGIGGGHVRIRRPVVRQELFDLAADPGEATSLVEQRPERAADLHRELVLRALEEQPGAWVVGVRGPGDEPARVQLELTLEGGSGWRAGVGDFPWPGEPEAWFGWTLGGGPSRSRLEVDVTGGRTLLVFTPHGPSSSTRARATDADGAPVQLAGPDGPLEAGPLESAAIEATPVRLLEALERPVEVPTVLLFRLPGGGSAEIDGPELPLDLLEQLRTLGYAE